MKLHIHPIENDSGAQSVIIHIEAYVGAMPPQHVHNHLTRVKEAFMKDSNVLADMDRRNVPYQVLVTAISYDILI